MSGKQIDKSIEQMLFGWDLPHYILADQIYIKTRTITTTKEKKELNRQQTKQIIEISNRIKLLI